MEARGLVVSRSSGERGGGRNANQLARVVWQARPVPSGKQGTAGFSAFQLIVCLIALHGLFGPLHRHVFETLRGGQR
jgi:hypothetical protein